MWKILDTPYKEDMAAKDKSLIEAALKASGGSKTKAAAWLGVTRNTLYARIKLYGLESKQENV